MSNSKKNSIIKEALEVLGKKNLALIIHSGSVPSLPEEDTSFGTINSNGGKALIDEITGVFNSIQLGPSGLTKSCDASPYTGTIFSSNPLFVDLKQLTTALWDKILSKNTFDEIVQENPNKNINKTAYSFIYKKQKIALLESFENFKKSKKLENLKKLFEIFKRDNGFWLDNDSIYEALSIEHNNDYWPLWESAIDKNLLNPQSIEEKIEFAKRIDEIEKKYANEIEFYKFVQFVIKQQNDSTQAYAKQNGIKMISDRQVAFSDRDIWAYKSLFLEGWSLGCPPDYFSKDGQAWGFPVLNPEKLFNGDGSLGEAGELMKNLFKKLFKENPGGVRIDHIVGLIDPWVYKTGKNPKVEEGAGRLYSSPEHPTLSAFAIPKITDLNMSVTPDCELRVGTLTSEQVSQYGRFIEKIVIAAAKEEGLNKDAIVCEDLGTITNPVAEVLKKYDLQGMKLTQFVSPEVKAHPYRCSNIPKRAWAMVGTHDNQPISMWADSLINTHTAYLHALNLVDDLFGDLQNKDEIIVRLTQDAEFLANAKLVELFASKAENVQIFFTDYFNVKEVYNKPGTSGDCNWCLRLPNNFKELKTIDLPLILRLAIEARGAKFKDENQKLIEKLNSL